MAEDLERTGGQDGKPVNAEHDHEVRYWAEWCLPLGSASAVRTDVPVAKDVPPS